MESESEFQEYYKPKDELDKENPKDISVITVDEYLMLIEFLKRNGFIVYMDTINIHNNTYEFSILSDGRFSSTIEAYDFFCEKKFKVTTVIKQTINKNEYYNIGIKYDSEYFSWEGFFDDDYNKEIKKNEDKEKKEMRRIHFVIALVFFVLILLTFFLGVSPNTETIKFDSTMTIMPTIYDRLLIVHCDGESQEFLEATVDFESIPNCLIITSYSLSYSRIDLLRCDDIQSITFISQYMSSEDIIDNLKKITTKSFHENGGIDYK